MGQIKGVVSMIETKTGVSTSGKEWAKTSFIVTEQKENPQSIIIDTFDNINLNDGDIVDATYITSVNFWKDKKFNNIKLVFCNKINSNIENKQQNIIPQQLDKVDNSDELPF